MTETEMKLQDAQIQFRLALEAADEATVRSCVNSLISLARSVTFVMQTESAGDAKLSSWYRQRMDELLKSPVASFLRFFNDKRVYSIHRGVIVPKRLTPTITEFKFNGVLQPSGQTMIFYRFDGVEEYLPNDSGGAFRLCEIYITNLRSLVDEWLVKRKEFGVL